MKHITVSKKIVYSSILFLLSFSLFSETFRVSKTHVISLSDNQSEDLSLEFSETLGITEALAIYLPDDNNPSNKFDKIFLEGIEIKMDIPEAIASYMDSVACSVYDKINPLPTTSQIDYSATRQYVSTLPGRLSWILQIPLKEKNSIKTNRYTTKIDTVPSFEKNVIFVRLQPVMKGVPEETLKAKINMTIKPLFIDKGQLALNIYDSQADETSDNTNLSCIVYIDDKLVSYSPAKNKILLDTGVHTISIVSEDFRNEVRTVRIDQAKTTSLSINLKSTEPTLLINSPEAAVVELDGEPCSQIGKEFVITEGEHKVLFRIGDYEILRTIQAIKGKTYTANFSVDVELIEE